MIGYDKVGWLNMQSSINNPVLNKEGCGRTGEQKVGWMNNQWGECSPHHLIYCYRVGCIIRVR